MNETETGRQQIKVAVKEFVMSEFLPGEDPNELTETTPLISGGILDSIATLKMVAFLEERYGIKFEAHEMSPDYIDTLSGIASFVESKLS